MMLYLDGNSRPYIVYAADCDAHYILTTKHTHELDLKGISNHLKATLENKVLIINNASVMHIYCYYDTNFSGIYIHK